LAVPLSLGIADVAADVCTFLCTPDRAVVRAENESRQERRLLEWARLDSNTPANRAFPAFMVHRWGHAVRASGRV
jgi:hypothetical protein